MQDILIDDNGDFLLDGNNMLIRSKSDNQHKMLLLIINKGGFKESPNATVGLMAYLESENVDELYSDIRRAFTDDGMTVSALGINTSGKLEVDAEYTN